MHSPLQSLLTVARYSKAAALLGCELAPVVDFVRSIAHERATLPAGIARLTLTAGPAPALGVPKLHVTIFTAPGGASAAVTQYLAPAALEALRRLAAALREARVVPTGQVLDAFELGVATPLSELWGAGVIVPCPIACT